VLLLLPLLLPGLVVVLLLARQLVLLLTAHPHGNST
jgi:hypothetical protein